MNTRMLVPVNWTLWGILVVVILYALVRVSTERTSDSTSWRGLGIVAVLFILVLLAGAAAFLVVAARRDSAKWDRVREAIAKRRAGATDDG